MRILPALLTLTCAGFGNYGQVAHMRDIARSPVLVELFTSEGCSSCPPVDTLLQQMDASQPFPQAQLIVLSEHVDYWNHDGWKDPYSSSLFTDRQNSYVRALGLSEPYTPQIIVQGSMVLRSSDPQQVHQIFEKAGTAPQVRVRIVALRIEEASQPFLRVRIEADGESALHNADVYLAVALDHAASQVVAGENSGRHLTHVAVVEYLKKVGKLQSGKSFGQDCEVKLKKNIEATNLRVVAFVQESGPGKVMGAALRGPSPSTSLAPANAKVLPLSNKVSTR